MLGDIYGLYHYRTVSLPTVVPASPSPSLGTAGRIILVEDYDALSIAFGSTLRKLAPSHQTVLVRSLAEAEIAAAASKPDLFVIDFDPPHAGAVDFFNRMKTAQPNARVLVIGATIWPELAQERIRTGALQFIAKPFELAKFGATVQSLLQSGRASATLPAGGALRDLDLTDLVALFGVATVTTILRVTATGGATGEISFSAGQITQAVVMGKAGVAALEEMLRWPSPRFVENEMRGNPPRALHGPWTAVLMEALRSVRTIEPPEPKSDMPADAAPPENKIVVIDDTELLLIFVEDILRTARPSLEIATAASGMEGLKRTTELLPDLVLLDYSLPDVAGDEVCRLLLADERTANIPVIMMSGHVAEMAATAARFSNVVATIGKPFLSAALLDLVQATLANLPTVAAPPAQQEKSAPRQTGKKVRKPRTTPSATKTRAKSPAAIPVQTNPELASAHLAATPAAATTKPKENRNGAFAIPEPESSPLAPEPPISLPPDPSSAVPAPVEPPHEVAAARASPPGSEASAPSVAPFSGNQGSPRQGAQINSSEEAQEASGSPGLSAPARIRAAKSSTVVLTLPLEITSIQFSPSLQTRAIRARPYSSIVSVHILPDAVSRVRVAAMAFELDYVVLDARGQIGTVRLMPSAQPVAATESGSSMIIADIAAFPRDGTMEITPSPEKPTRIRLLALFEIVAVELTATFGVEYLILKTRGAKVRVHLRPGEAKAGLTFQSAQVLLDSSGRIAEVLLDAPE